jgi:ATP-dependent protease ClpP protease subunit
MEDTDRDFFMSANDAKIYGLIDEVILNPSDLALQNSGIPMYVNEL